jgi:peptide/nickel transport system substrate-binding protein
MPPWTLPLLATLLVVMAVTACGQQAPSSQPGSSSTGAAAGAPRRLIASIMGQPPSLAHARTNPPGTVGSTPGIDALEELLVSGLGTLDDQGALRPLLATQVPSAENGAWKVLPDGRMEMTWTIRDGARWQDGTPFTAADLVFTLAVERDKEIPFVHSASLDLIENIQAVDDRTAIVTWASPYIEADTLFTVQLALPLPKHLLENAFIEDKVRFAELPYWGHEFIGTGPFKVRDWVEGSHTVLVANDSYVLGRPKIDEIEVRFIQDGNTLIANILSGTVGVTLGRGLDIEQSLQIRGQRPDIQILYASGGWVPIYPQFQNPSPQIIAEPAFRRALLVAIDRQAITDAINHGLVPIADAFVTPGDRAHASIAASIVKYGYDPRQAGQMVADLGYGRGQDGMFRDGTGQELQVELRTTAQREHHMKALYPVADDWQRIGVGVETLVVPIQRIPDRPYRASYPGFELVGGSNGVNSSDVKKYHSSSAPTPENGFRVAGNNARYMNPELDGLIDRYVTTISFEQRMAVLRQIVHHQTDLVTVMGLFYQLRPTVVAVPLERVTPGNQSGDNAWNAYEWSFK